MYDFLKYNRVLALALAGTAAFLLWFVLWLVGLLSSDRSEVTPITAAVESGGVTPAEAGTAPHLVLPACAPTCPGPWRSPSWRRHHPDLFPNEPPSQSDDTP